jgi:protein tyrosine/serine phosphatase
VPRGLSPASSAGSTAAAHSQTADIAQVRSDRVLEWDGLFNARDLGGLPTQDGGRTRRGALIRSDVLTRLTPAGKEALVAHGVRAIIDIRFPHETALDRDAYPFHEAGAGDDVPAYRNESFFVPLPPAEDAAVKAAYSEAGTRTALNRMDIDQGRAGVAAIATAVARASAGGVLVHCHGGKDRTGAVVAVLLSLVGVSDDEIADDYALSAVNLGPLTQEWLDGITHDPSERARLLELARPTREAMLDTLVHLRERHGGAEAYLRAGGASGEDLERLRKRLVEPT